MNGREIQFKRKFLGLTQQELADRCGVTKQSIAAIESGKSGVTKPMERVIDWELGKAFVECKKFNLSVVACEIKES